MKGHVDERAKKTLALVFRVFGLRESGKTEFLATGIPKSRNAKPLLNFDRGHRRWSREERVEANIMSSA